MENSQVYCTAAYRQPKKFARKTFTKMNGKAIEINYLKMEYFWSDWCNGLKGPTSTSQSFNAFNRTVSAVVHTFAAVRYMAPLANNFFAVSLTGLDMRGGAIKKIIETNNIWKFWKWHRRFSKNLEIEIG